MDGNQGFSEVCKTRLSAGFILCMDIYGGYIERINDVHEGNNDQETQLESTTFQVRSEYELKFGQTWGLKPWKG